MSVKDGIVIVDDKKQTNYVTLGEPLGKGGFGMAYEVVEQISGRKYAIKVVTKEKIKPAYIYRKFDSEYKIHSRINHPFICRLHRLFSDTQNYYLLMELCDAKTLKQFSEIRNAVPNTSRQQLSEEEVQRIAYELLQALSYLHKRLVIHRDMKPENIFLQHFRTDNLSTIVCKLGDFGLAHQLSCEDEHRKTICGTPHYFPPELVMASANTNKEKPENCKRFGLSEDVFARVAELEHLKAEQGQEPFSGASGKMDSWGLGVLLYELIAHKPPFSYEKLPKMNLNILDGKFEPLLPNSVYSNYCCNFVHKLLTPDENLRYSISEALADPWIQNGSVVKLKCLPAKSAEMQLKSADFNDKFARYANYSDQIRFFIELPESKRKRFDVAYLEKQIAIQGENGDQFAPLAQQSAEQLGAKNLTMRNQSQQLIQQMTFKNQSLQFNNVVPQKLSQLHHATLPQSELTQVAAKSQISSSILHNTVNFVTIEQYIKNYLQFAVGERFVLIPDLRNFELYPKLINEIRAAGENTLIFPNHISTYSNLLQHKILNQNIKSLTVFRQTFISAWIAHIRFGAGIQFNDGVVSLRFNDGSAIVASANRKYVDIIDKFDYEKYKQNLISLQGGAKIGGNANQLQIIRCQYKDINYFVDEGKWKVFKKFQNYLENFNKKFIPKDQRDEMDWFVQRYFGNIYDESCRIYLKKYSETQILNNFKTGDNQLVFAVKLSKAKILDTNIAQIVDEYFQSRKDLPQYENGQQQLVYLFKSIILQDCLQPLNYLNKLPILHQDHTYFSCIRGYQVNFSDKLLLFREQQKCVFANHESYQLLFQANCPYPMFQERIADGSNIHTYYQQQFDQAKK